MKKQLAHGGSFIVAILLAASAVAAPQQTRADKERDARMAEAGRAGKEAKDREQMRDKSNDGRVGIGKDASMGGTVEKDGATVNVRISTK